MRLHLPVIAAFALSFAAPTFAAAPFSDVPAGHWAYKAIEKAVEAGILQGYDGNFHGNKTLNRYQMAVVVARMLDRIETMGPGGKMGKKDIESIEALVIEFADELALLNVKVSTLEDAFAELKKDVEGLKKGHGHGGSAGISGLFQGRMALTDDDSNHIQGRGGLAAAGAASATPFAANNVYVAGGAAVAAGGAGVAAGTAGATASAVAATQPLARYVGGVPTGAPATTGGDSRLFGNIAQTSIAFDRHYDEDYYLHMQLDFDADTESNYVSGNNVQINEAFIDIEKWLFDGDVRIKAGTWALPFQRERNPEMVDYPNQLRFGMRSLDLTISPAFWDANWESVRVLGAGLWNGKDNGFKWQVAATSSTSPNYNSDGTVLAWRGAAQAGANLSTARGAAGFRPLSRPFGFAGAQAQNSADFAGGTGGASLYGDALNSVDNNTSAGAQNEMGYYAWIGDKYAGGFRWDAGYFDNGGNINPAAGEIGTASEWRGIQINAGWWGWEDIGIMGSYYAADSDSATFAGAAGTTNVVGGARNFVELGLFPALAAGGTYPDVESTAFSALFNYRFNDENNVSVRYEDIEDTAGAAEISATVWTFAWNHRISPNSLLQLEYVTPESESVTVAPGGGAAGGAAGGTGAVTRNTVDVNDDLVQLNYKVRF